MAAHNGTRMGVYITHIVRIRSDDPYMATPAKSVGTGFTPRQQDAIEHTSGNLQLIACAGSGKTEVVAQRVVNLLRPVTKGGAGCDPRNIVAFTFTEKAAAELKERIHIRCQEQLG